MAECGASLPWRAEMVIAALGIILGRSQPGVKCRWPGILQHEPSILIQKRVELNSPSVVCRHGSQLGGARLLGWRGSSWSGALVHNNLTYRLFSPLVALLAVDGGPSWSIPAAFPQLNCVSRSRRCSAACVWRPGAGHEEGGSGTRWVSAIGPADHCAQVSTDMPVAIASAPHRVCRAA